jgi:LPS export ABC transporter protein LptC
MSSWAESLGRILLLSTVISGSGLGIWWLSLPKAEQNLSSEVTKPPGSSLSSVTLTEFDAKGNQIWEVKAKRAEYNQENRSTDVYDVTGRFFRNGKPIMQASAQRGSVNQADRAINLTGKAKAIALQDNVVVTSEKLSWQSDLDLLTATEKVKVEKPDRKITISGKALKANPSINQYRVEQDVIALSVKPPLKLVGATFIWDANKDTVTSPFAFGVRQTESDFRVRANKGLWTIKTETIALDGEVRAKAPKLDLQIDTSKLTWDIAKQIVMLPNPLKVVSAKRGIEVNALAGNVNLDKAIVQITGQVNAKAATNQSQITADQALWSLGSQAISATGNVNYRQTEKNVWVSGTKAVADLKAQTINVTGAEPGVVTNISIP